MIKKILISTAAVLAAMTIHAQSVSFINLSDNARRMAMGGADAAYSVSKVLDDSYAHGTADASYMMWQPQALGNNIFMLDGFYRFGKFGISAGGRYNMYKPLAAMSDQGNPGASFTPSEFMAFVGFHYGILENLAVMANVKFISSTLMAKYSGSAVAADLGVAYDVSGVKIALSARNLGSRLTYAKNVQNNLPMTVLLGGEKAFAIGSHTLDVALDAGYMPLHSCFVARAGAEFSIMNIMDIRAGYHFGSNSKVEPGYASVGVGANINAVRLGATYFIAGGSSPLRNTLAFSLGARF